ncbi:MAG: hypothetical protein ACI8Z9_002010 [Paraglaciecola sp.]|jgi:hypothetical protein
MKTALTRDKKKPAKFAGKTTSFKNKISREHLSLQENLTIATDYCLTSLHMQRVIAVVDKMRVHCISMRVLYN